MQAIVRSWQIIRRVAGWSRHQLLAAKMRAIDVKSDYLEDESKAAEAVDLDTAIQLACLEIKRVFKVRRSKSR
ncbi:hypothetical protein E2C01_088585 [Portunus trituberculatus]|uniref:Uncharacterized protein n=1 Tax=Portunus trituberculatus TaxID=210409 RepID=A0A5B7JJS7_PORTR|nr:hypothetical protein [Portunus trituberculatus]